MPKTKRYLRKIHHHTGSGPVRANDSKGIVFLNFVQLLLPVIILFMGLCICFWIWSGSQPTAGQQLELRVRQLSQHVDLITAVGVAVTAVVSLLVWFLLRARIQALRAAQKMSVELECREQSEKALQASEQRLHEIINMIPVSLFIKDAQSRITLMNRACEAQWGMAFSELQGTTASQFFPPEQMAVFLAKDRDAFAGRQLIDFEEEVWNDTLAENRVVHTFKKPVFDQQGQPQYLIGVCVDITEKKQSDELIWRQANFDGLTQLPNRRMSRDRLEHEVKKAHRANLGLALLLVDLDQFKEVNDTLGHHIGDALLIEAARRICTCVRDSDTVARLGGDEFTIILTELADTSCVDRIAQAIIQALSQSFTVADEVIYLSASIGITMYPTDASDVDNLLKNADQAMYVAKNAGRNRFSYFTPSLQAEAQARQALVKDLRHALAANQFCLYFQPIMDLASQRIVKAEALIRWRHPQRGIVNPVEFIGTAEETGLINAIGDWVFKEATQHLKHWLVWCPADFQMGINMSPVQFYAHDNNPDLWVQHIRELELPQHSVVIEITEGILLHADAGISEKLLKFHEAGIQVSIDDFGTGYSSLAYLKKFAVDYLKIDQSFVRDLVSDPNDLALSEAIIVMAHKLGLKVVAEGIETAEQQALLTKAGCDYGQGYLFSKPMPAYEFECLLKRTMTIGEEESSNDAGVPSLLSSYEVMPSEPPCSRDDEQTFA